MSLLWVNHEKIQKKRNICKVIALPARFNSTSTREFVADVAAVRIQTVKWFKTIYLSFSFSMEISCVMVPSWVEFFSFSHRHRRDDRQGTTLAGCVGEGLENLRLLFQQMKIIYTRALCQEKFIWSFAVYALGPHRAGLENWQKFHFSSKVKKMLRKISWETRELVFRVMKICVHIRVKWNFIVDDLRSVIGKFVNHVELIWVTRQHQWKPENLWKKCLWAAANEILHVESVNSN